MVGYEMVGYEMFYRLGGAFFSKNVDKASEVVVWDREDYIEHSQNQRKDKNEYRKINFENKTHSIRSRSVFARIAKPKVGQQIKS